MMFIDGTPPLNFTTSLSFEEAMKEHEAEVLVALRQLVDLADRCPFDSPLRDLLREQSRDLMHITSAQEATRYALVAALRRRAA